MSREVVVLGAGSYAPDNLVTNEEIIKRFEHMSFPGEDGNKIDGRTYLEAFVERLGYKQRYKLKDPEETTATMCVKACQEALKNAGVKAEEIDMIILSTDSPDFISPPTSSRIQYELGAKNASFFDINAACAGYTVALNTAWNFLKGQEELKYALVIGGYGMSRFSNPEDPATELMFADGAGALVLKAEENTNNGIKAATMQGQGEYWDYMGIYGCGTWKNLSKEALDQKLQYVKILKLFPATINTHSWPPLVLETIKKAGWGIEDVDHIFFTQVNLSVIEEVCEALNFVLSKAHTIMDKYGYTGSACIPMAIADALKKNILKEGDKVAICTSGGGAAFAAAALVWGK